MCEALENIIEFFAARYILNTSFQPQSSYSNPLSFGARYNFILSQKIDLRE
jgi:hypothetical protein